MAKKSETAAKSETASVNGEAKTPKESAYNSIVVRWHKSADFDPESALTALGESQGHVVKSRTAKKSGKVTLQVDTAESSKVSGRGRPRKLVSKETEQAAIKLLRAAMKDPTKAPQITALLAASAEGKDVSGELSQLVGLTAK
jgi:hypothetical protein